MPLDPKKCNEHDRFEHLLKVVSSQKFLNKEGLGNEVPFFICEFPPGATNEVYTTIKNLHTRLNLQEVKVLEINLYDLVLEIMQEEDDLDWYIKNEATMSKQEFLNDLQAMADAETVLIPRIESHMNNADFDVLFITGVGEVFPFIRSHNVLNNLQLVAKDKPTILFFPGEYKFSLEGGASLELFGRMTDDKYYRAYNIYHYEVS